MGITSWVGPDPPRPRREWHPHRRGFGGEPFINDDFQVSKNRRSIWASLRLSDADRSTTTLPSSTSLQARRGSRDRMEFLVDSISRYERLGAARGTGMAATGSDSMAIRASYGIFYDRLLETINPMWKYFASVECGAIIRSAGSRCAVGEHQPAFPDAESLRWIAFKDAILFNLQGRRNPYIQQWTASIQKTLPAQFFLELALHRLEETKLSAVRPHRADDLQPGDITAALSEQPSSATRNGLSTSRTTVSVKSAVASGDIQCLPYPPLIGGVKRILSSGTADYRRSIFGIRQRFVAT